MKREGRTGIPDREGLTEASEGIQEGVAASDLWLGLYVWATGCQAEHWGTTLPREGQCLWKMEV